MTPYKSPLYIFTLVNEMEDVRIQVSGRRINWRAGVGFAILMVAIVIALVFAGTVVGNVSVSEAAIVVDPLGGGKRVVIGPKMFFKLPWEYYVKIYLGIESLSMWTEVTGRTGDWPAITCLTKDGLEVKVDISVRWRVDPNHVLELYEAYPRLDWEDTTLASLLRESVRDVISRYTAVETIEKRSEISRKIVDTFKEAIASESNLAKAIIIEGVDLRNIELPSDFKRAVEQKLAEEQQKLAAEFKKERLLIEANATATSQILQARGAALASIEKAKGEAQAILIKANATAQAYKLIIMSLGGNQSQVAYLLALKEALKDVEGPVIVVLSPSGNVAPIVPIPVTTTSTPSSEE